MRQREWRLMTHSELEMSYKSNDIRDSAEYYHAYITFYYPPEPNGDPLYSIDVCDGMNEDRNIELAMSIIQNLNQPPI